MVVSDISNSLLSDINNEFCIHGIIISTVKLIVDDVIINTINKWNKLFIPLDVKGSEKLNDIKFITEYKQGDIWFGGRYGILWKYDGNELKDFTQAKRKN